MKRLAQLASLALLFVAVGSCRGDKGPDEPTGGGEYARRSAISFIHCVESGSSGCVKSGVDLGGWDAFFLLGWLSDGSPTSILQALRNELQLHSDPLHVQGRFVQIIERYQTRLRGAECDPVGVQEIQPMIRTVSGVARERLKSFGLWTPDMEGVVAGLQSEAEQGLSSGHLVRMQCRTDPYQVYVATAQRGNRQEIMGLTLMLPRFLGGEQSNRDNVTGRRSSVGIGDQGAITVREGTVHAWLPVPVEGF